jgi:hypothetical protein
MLQICQDDLINISLNGPLSLEFTYTTSRKQMIIDEDRTRHESTYTYIKVQPKFAIATLVMHTFQMVITNANNTEIIAYINHHRPKYPYDDYAYEFMVLNHNRYNAYELGLLLIIGLVVDQLRTYPETADEKYYSFHALPGDFVYPIQEA